MASEHGDDASRTSRFDQPNQPQYGPSPTGAGSQPYYGGPQQPQPPRKSQTLIVVLIVLISVTALLLIGLVAAAIYFSSSDKAESVFASCTEQVPDARSATLTSDEKSIQFNWGEYPVSSDFAMLTCLLDETGAPSAVQARMESTRALDGTQDAEWDNWSAFWNYHPDDGLDATFTVE